MIKQATREKTLDRAMGIANCGIEREKRAVPAWFVTRRSYSARCEVVIRAGRRYALY